MRSPIKTVIEDCHRLGVDRKPIVSSDTSRIIHYYV